MSSAAANELNNALGTLPEPAESPILMPLTHLSITEWFNAIVTAGKLTPRMCGVFLKDLTYLFYGGVFYRPENKVTRKVTELPVAFVFSPAVLDKIYRVFPFDTGALAKGRFGHWGSSLMPFEKFEISCGGGIDVLSKLVHYTFGGNEQYLKGQPDPGCRAGPEPLPLLYDFYADDLTPLGVDHRQCIIEGQASTDIPLGEDLLWVGFPESMTLQFKQLCEWTKPVIPDYYSYDSHAIKNPAEYAAILEREAHQRVIQRYVRLP